MNVLLEGQVPLLCALMIALTYIVRAYKQLERKQRDSFWRLGNAVDDCARLNQEAQEKYKRELKAATAPCSYCEKPRLKLAEHNCASCGAHMKAVDLPCTPNQWLLQ